MLYEPEMTNNARTVLDRSRRIKRHIGLLFHPDKSPYSKSVVPPGTPPLKQYESVFGDMIDAMSFFEKYLTLHLTIGQTLLPSR